MDTTTTPKFDYLDKFPREIRDIIFGYMVQNTIESYRRPINHDAPVSTRNDFRMDGLDTSDAQTHLISSPWVTLNKQYCAEYLQVFVREGELRRRFTSPYRRFTKSQQLAELIRVLQLVTQRFDIASRSADIEKSSKTLVSRIKRICFSYYYRGSYFETGFGKPERREYPRDGFLQIPLASLRQLREDYDIPSNRLFININYGDPSWTVLACLGLPNSSDAPKYVASLRPVRARIQVDDYDASIVAIDKELEVLKWRNYQKHTHRISRACSLD